MSSYGNNSSTSDTPSALSEITHLPCPDCGQRFNNSQEWVEHICQPMTICFPVDQEFKPFTHKIREDGLHGRVIGEITYNWACKWPKGR